MRRLTVSTLRREWRAMNCTRQGFVPWIRIAGNWLEEAGFSPGARITVEIANAASPARTTLIIRKENDERL